MAYVKSITPAAIKWLSNLAEGRQISSHPSQRDAMMERGYATYSNGRYSITEAGREFLRRKNPGDPYNSAPVKPDPWRHVPVKKDRRKNPGRASVIYAQRKGRKGEVMYFDGQKFTNNEPPKYFGTHDRARGVAQQLVSRYPTLSSYRVWVGPPLPVLRRRNPESRGLEEAAKRLEDFSGHQAKKVITVHARSHAKEGLVIGELDLIGYRTRRKGIGADKVVRYAHDFSKGSRPLLAVTKDGKQLHIVGGQYEFTDAGIEDR